MVQRDQLVEDTMVKVEGMRGKDVSKPVFIKKGVANTAATFCNNNNNNNTYNNNNKRPNAGRDYAVDKKVKVEGRQIAENCRFCDKLRHRAEECWKKLGACLRCGGRDHRIPNCPMLKDQPGKAQNVPRHQGRLNAVVEADLPKEGGMVEVALEAQEVEENTPKWSSSSQLCSASAVQRTLLRFDQRLEHEMRRHQTSRSLLHERDVLDRRIPCCMNATY
ncbi:hypothetical protein Taro_043889 [Colocasia esculenta]|uniref:CCHC-type domain-containing protein n=1 Tax=Colocasia esculenta TaxID=4460 RepID=A0A843WZR2_COLES|nr:hypothetical protein [Colocasia esculenta]